DIRGDGGYIVVSPSIHESGREYAWELDHYPSMMEIAAAPQWLLDALLPKTNGKFKARPVSDYINILQEVHEGERNNALMTLIDRKSTRLNSSHVSISYAVFCLKKRILERFICSCYVS